MNFRLILIITSILTVGCSNETSGLIGKNYSAEYYRLKCFDSLKFVTDSTVQFYSCDVGWEYNCFYMTKGDTVVIESNLTQLDDNNFNKYDSNLRMTLFKDGMNLKQLSIEHKFENKWKLDTSDVLSYFDKFTMIK